MTRTRQRKPAARADIYVISPAGAVDDSQRLEQAVAALAARGFHAVLDRAALARDRRFAGTDVTRVAAFDRAAMHAAPIVMITRGGYGLTRILHRLDFERLAAAQKHWVGYSDFTAFSLAMLARAGAGTWAGPTLLADFSPVQGPIDDVTADAFSEAINGQTEALGFSCHGPSGVDVEGTLWGGNLRVLCSLIGTPWLPQVRGGILFLEDVGEHPYRIERMFAQLVDSGIVDSQAAILLGSFNEYRLAPNDRGYDLPDAIKWLRSRTRVPVITGLPFGHAHPKLTLPHGARLGLATDRHNAWLLFPHQH